MFQVYLLQVTCSLLILYIPGLTLARISRIKGVAAWAIAPLISLSICALGAVLADLAGIRWGIASFALMAALSFVPAYLLSRKCQPVHMTAPPRWLLPTGIVACLLQIIPFYFATSVQSPIQQIDSTFHMNLVWNILKSGNGSTFGGATRMYGLETTKTIYPSGWHDFVSLFTTKETIVSGVNSMHFVVGVLWVIGLSLLAYGLFPKRPDIVLATQICSSVVSVYPTYLQSAYPVFPNSLAVACLPSLGAAFVLLFRVSDPRTLYDRVFRIVFLSSLVLPLCLVHPSFLFNVGMLGLGSSLYMLWNWLRALSAKQRAKALVTVGSALAAMLVVATVTIMSNGYILGTLHRMATAYETTPNVSLSAFIKILSLASADPIPVSSLVGASRHLLAFLCLFVTLMGMVFVRHFGKSAIVVTCAWVAMSLVVLSTMWRIFPLTILGGIWYMSPYRALSALAVPHVIIMALGVSACLSVLPQIVSKYLKISAKKLNPLLYGISALALVSTIPLGVIAKASYYRMVYNPDSTFSTIVASSGEIAMLNRIREEKLDKGLILGDPMNGSALAQAVSGREVVLPQLYYRPSNKAENYLKNRFSDIGRDQEVCDVLKKHHIAYFYYDSDLSNMAKNSEKQSPGFYRNINWSALRIIDSGGTAALYEITACN